VIVNISCYRFVSLDDRESLKAALTARCETLGLLGTILIAPEGINIFLAGSRAGIDGFMKSLHADPRFAGLVPKESVSTTPPFKKLRVRLKKEIITMKHPLIRPEAGRAPAVDAVTLARWLDRGCDDAGRPVVMLDTRNDYEVAVGAFALAVDYRLASFSEFPAALENGKAAFAGKTVVSYCTGGIRCEKAAIHMKAVGVEHVYQLDGGILKYFEETGGAHYDGDCFVFDERIAVAPDLSPAQRQLANAA
jgi:UPF0176 protein